MIALENRSMKFNFLLMLITFMLPFLLYIYLLFPSESSIDLYLFSIKLYFHKSIDTYIWMIFLKVYVIAFLTIWYLSIQDKWKLILLYLIVFKFFQLVPIITEIHGNTKINLLGIFVGIIYSIALYKFALRYNFIQPNKLNLLTFDIVKIVTLGLSEKSNYEKKRGKYETILKSKVNDKNTLEKCILIDKIKELEVFTTTKNYNESVFRGSDIKKNYTIPILLLATPCLFFLFRLIDPNIKSIDLGIFTLTSNYASLKGLIWLTTIKIFNVLLLSIWFFTTKNILKYGVFINLVIALFQLVTVVYDETKTFDENELLYTIPITVPLVLILYFLGKYVKYNDKNEQLNQKFETAIDQIIKEINANDSYCNKYTLKLEEVKKNQNLKNKNIYYSELRHLKTAIENQLMLD